MDWRTYDTSTREPSRTALRRDRRMLPPARIAVAALAAFALLAGATGIMAVRVRSSAPELTLGALDALGLTTQVNSVLTWAHGTGVVATGVVLVMFVAYLLVLLVEYAAGARLARVRNGARS